MPRRVVFLKNEPLGCPEASKSEKQTFGESRNTFITYGNQNNPKRQEGAPKFYFLTHTIPDFYTRKKG